MLPHHQDDGDNDDDRHGRWVALLDGLYDSEAVIVFQALAAAGLDVTVLAEKFGVPPPPDLVHGAIQADSSQGGEPLSALAADGTHLKKSASNDEIGETPEDAQSGVGRKVSESREGAKAGVVLLAIVLKSLRKHAPDIFSSFTEDMATRTKNHDFANAFINTFAMVMKFRFVLLNKSRRPIQPQPPVSPLDCVLDVMVKKGRAVTDEQKKHVRNLFVDQVVVYAYEYTRESPNSDVNVKRALYDALNAMRGLDKFWKDAISKLSLLQMQNLLPLVTTDLESSRPGELIPPFHVATLFHLVWDDGVKGMIPGGWLYIDHTDSGYVCRFWSTTNIEHANAIKILGQQDEHIDWRFLKLIDVTQWSSAGESLEVLWLDEISDMVVVMADRPTLPANLNDHIESLYDRIEPPTGMNNTSCPPPFEPVATAAASLVAAGALCFNPAAAASAASAANQSACCLPCPAAFHAERAGLLPALWRYNHVPVISVSAAGAVAVVAAHAGLGRGAGAAAVRRRPARAALLVSLNVAYVLQCAAVAASAPDPVAPLCAQTYVPATQDDNRLCLAQAVLMRLGTFGVAVSVALIVLDLHLKILWKNHCMDSYFLWFLLGAWTLAGALTSISAALHKVVASPGGWICITNIPDMLRLDLGPQAAVFGLALLVQVATLVFSAMHWWRPATGGGGGAIVTSSTASTGVGGSRSEAPALPMTAIHPSTSPLPSSGALCIDADDDEKRQRVRKQIRSQWRSLCVTGVAFASWFGLVGVMVQFQRIYSISTSLSAASSAASSADAGAAVSWVRDWIQCLWDRYPDGQNACRDVLVSNIPNEAALLFFMDVFMSGGLFSFVMFVATDRTALAGLAALVLPASLRPRRPRIVVFASPHGGGAGGTLGGALALGFRPSTASRSTAWSTVSLSSSSSSSLRAASPSGPVWWDGRVEAGEADVTDANVTTELELGADLSRAEPPLAGTEPHGAHVQGEVDQPPGPRPPAAAVALP
ncbi:hypothetical protein HK405_002082 [Cladochytrium tenue]|nr:hypothetical protein HK405_002082 [Cladochytrium tenue]